VSSFLDQTRARVPRLAEVVAQQRARLSVVATGTTRAPRLPFAAFVLAVLGLGLVGLLVLNTTLQHQAFRARSLEHRADGLAVRRQALELEVDALRSPDLVARAAHGLGMVPNHSPAFLFLANGTVRGDTEPAGAAGAIRLDPLPPRARSAPEDAPRAGSGTRGQGVQRPSVREQQGRDRGTAHEPAEQRTGGEARETPSAQTATADGSGVDASRNRPADGG
jgi:hypothetical protein